MQYWYRARQHPPLGHQLSHSGKGSLGQPPRIQAFWPAMGDPYKTPAGPPQAVTPRSASRGKKRSPKTRAFMTSPTQGQGADPRSLRDQTDMVDLQELGRPVMGVDGEPAEKKSPAGVQLTRHLEYDILQCIAKNRPEVEQILPSLSNGTPPPPPPKLTPSLCQLTCQHCTVASLSTSLKGVASRGHVCSGIQAVYHEGLSPGANASAHSTSAAILLCCCIEAVYVNPQHNRQLGLAWLVHVNSHGIAIYLLGVS